MPANDLDVKFMAGEQISITHTDETPFLNPEFEVSGDRTVRTLKFHHGPGIRLDALGIHGGKPVFEGISSPIKSGRVLADGPVFSDDSPNPNLRHLKMTMWKTILHRETRVPERIDAEVKAWVTYTASPYLYNTGEIRFSHSIEFYGVGGMSAVKDRWGYDGYGLGTKTAFIERTIPLGPGSGNYDVKLLFVLFASRVQIHEITVQLLNPF